MTGRCMTGPVARRAQHLPCGDGSVHGGNDCEAGPSILVIQSFHKRSGRSAQRYQAQAVRLHGAPSPLPSCCTHRLPQKTRSVFRDLGVEDDRALGVELPRGVRGLPDAPLGVVGFAPLGVVGFAPLGELGLAPLGELGLTPLGEFARFSDEDVGRLLGVLLLRAAVRSFAVMTSLCASLSASASR